MASHVLRCQSCLGITVYNILFIEGQTKLFRARANTVLMGLKPRNLLLAKVKSSNLYRVSGIGQTAMEFLRVDSKNHVHDSMRVQLLQLCDAHCRHLDRDGGS